MTEVARRPAYVWLLPSLLLGLAADGLMLALLLRQAPALGGVTGVVAIAVLLLLTLLLFAAPIGRRVCADRWHQIAFALLASGLMSAAGLQLLPAMGGQWALPLTALVSVHLSLLLVPALALLGTEPDEARLLRRMALVHGLLLSALLGAGFGLGAIAPLMQAAVVAGLLMLAALACLLPALRGVARAAPLADGSALPWRALSEDARKVLVAKPLWLALLGVGWFWLDASVCLLAIPGQWGAADMALGLFGFAALLVGTAVGAGLTVLFSGDRLELGLVPLGALGMTLLPVFWYLSYASGAAPGEQSAALLVTALLGASGSLFVVPLLTLLQLRTRDADQGLLAALMVAVAALGLLLAGGYVLLARWLGLNAGELILATALMSAAVSGFIFRLMPEFLMRLIVWVVIHVMYRIDKRGLENIPATGPVVLVCNHVSFTDPLIIGGVIRRPVRFVMDYGIFRTPVVGFVFRTAKTIPIASGKTHPEILERAYERIAEELEDGQVVCIYPEGQITRDGELNTFREGIERIVQRNPVPVVPMALRGLWGSWFSRKAGAAMKGLPQRLRAKIELVVDQPLSPQAVSAPDLQRRVQALRGDWR